MSNAYIPQNLRVLVSEQAHYRCGYCLTQEWIVGTPMEIDHLIPESLGGLTVLENLWLACTLCNNHKNNKIAAIDPISGALVRLYNPRDLRWTEHFRWSEEGNLIIGLTEIGRATVIALQLNRPSLVSARQAWVSVGWHPPVS